MHRNRLTDTIKAKAYTSSRLIKDPKIKDSRLKKLKTPLLLYVKIFKTLKKAQKNKKKDWRNQKKGKKYKKKSSSTIKINSTTTSTSSKIAKNKNKNGTPNLDLA